jgi:acyl dehydratase
MYQEPNVRRFLFPIEAGQVLHFARAIGDPNPVFRDPDYAAIAMKGGIVPPPTFLIAAHHFDPECPLRPVPGEAAPGTGVIPLAGPIPHSERPRGLHAEETFVFHRHPRIGEVLTVDVRAGDTREKPGRENTLRFKDTVWEYRDAGNILIATATWISVFLEPPQAGTHAPRTDQAPRAAKSEIPRSAAPSSPPALTSLPDAPLSARQLRPGDEWTARVVDELRMMHLINYAGASGDLIALHYDERIVRAMGHPGLFGHGMLTMGLSGRVLSAVAGTSSLQRYSARMTAIVFPGDALTTTLTVDKIHQEQNGTRADFSLRTVNQDGRTVLTGSATAALAT